MTYAKSGTCKDVAGQNMDVGATQQSLAGC